MSDLEGNLLAVDSQICEIVQRSETELIGMTYEALTHPDDRSRNVSLIKSLSAGSGSVSIKKRYLRPDGSTVWAQAYVSVLGNPTDRRLVGTITMLAAPSGDLVRTRWESAKRATVSLHSRRDALGADLSNDYSFAIMLALYLADVEGRFLDIVNLSNLIQIPASLASRWLDALASRNYVENLNARQGIFQISISGVKAIERILDSM